MPENLSQERKDAMTAYGADLILVSKELGMEGARDLANQMSADKQRHFNLTNFLIKTTREPITKPLQKKFGMTQMAKSLTLSAAMGTTGTIMGVSKYLKEKNSVYSDNVGIQPDADSHISRYPSLA